MRALDHETPTVDAAGGFEHYNAEPDWDQQLAADDARREPRRDFTAPTGINWSPSGEPARPEDRDLW